MKKTKKNPKGAGRQSDTFNTHEFRKSFAAYRKKKQDSTEIISNNKGGATILYTVNMPSIEGFAFHLRITRKTLYNWAEKYEEVQRAMDWIKNEQLERLIDKGLQGSYNSTIVKLMLSHNHGIREQTEVKTEITQKFNDKQISRIAQRIASRSGSNGDSPSEK